MAKHGSRATRSPENAERVTAEMQVAFPPQGDARAPQNLDFLREDRVFRLDIHADARSIPLPERSVDLVVTSPPYWKKRDYGVDGQIGQEETPKAFVDNLLQALRDWRRVLTPFGSVFLNIGDTYYNKTLAAIPARVEAEASDDGWIVRNRIIWTKDGGMPEPASNRLANRHEYIIHLASTHKYYSDVHGYAERFGNGANPGDVWNIPLRRNMGAHLAPFPDDLVERAVLLACPQVVCLRCGKPRRRIVERTADLDPARPQARRAMQLAAEKGLTPEHIAAIQATGISDAGKALKVQNGTGRNSEAVKRLAAEAKLALGGYFREFTFARKRTAGWSDCGCGAPFRPGIVLDPFQGTGTTARVSNALGRSTVGVDLVLPTRDEGWQGELLDVGVNRGSHRGDAPSRGGLDPRVAQAQGTPALRRLPSRAARSSDRGQHARDQGELQAVL
jgi:DNA modification methylase